MLHFVVTVQVLQIIGQSQLSEQVDGVCVPKAKACMQRTLFAIKVWSVPTVKVAEAWEGPHPNVQPTDVTYELQEPSASQVRFAFPEGSTMCCMDSDGDWTCCCVFILFRFDACQEHETFKLKKQTKTVFACIQRG